MSLFLIVNIYLLAVLVRTIGTICIGYLYKNVSANQKIGGYNPLVSVLVPAYNEQVGIAKTVKSVLKSSYKNLEIIVIDDGSKDNTSKIVRDLIKKNNKLKRNKKKLKLLRKINGGKATALNHGILHAKGEVIVTIDGDSYIYPDAIEYLVKALADNKVDCAVGTIYIGNKRTLPGKVQFFEYIFGFHTKKSQSILNSIYVLPGALCAVKAKVFQEVGLYENYSKTEDFDMSLKIRKNGSFIAHVEEAICVTEGASDFKSLINQRTRWRHGGIVCLMKHRNLLFNIHKDKYLSFVELPLVIFGLFEILIYPFIMVLIFYSIFATTNPLNSIVYYMLMPFTFFLLVGDQLKKEPKLYPYLLIVPFFFMAIALVEFVALVKSLQKLIMKKEMQWGNWVRVGADSRV